MSSDGIITPGSDKEILDGYGRGQRYFADIDVEDGDLSAKNLSGAWFDRCFLAIDFTGTDLRGAKFTNSNIKTCDFRKADLTDALFQNVAFEGVAFKNASISGTIFNDNYAHGNTYQQDDFDKWIKDLDYA